MSDTRDDIARRVRALLNKTIDNGCTEAEALAAAEAARRIMDAHRLTQTDVQIEAEPIDDIWIERPTAQKLSAVDLCCSAISRYCGTKSWYEWKHGKRHWRVIGLADDTSMARYLYEMLATTIARETAHYTKYNRVPSRDAADTRRQNQSFSVGMAHRIARRLYEMAGAANATAVTSTGTALVVVKAHTVNAAFAALGLALSKGNTGPRAFSQAAYDAGRAAGDRVNLSRPLGGQAQGRIA